MLKEVQDIIMRIEAFLEGNEKFETVVEDMYTSIQVFARDYDASVYHGYELFLMKEVVEKLNHTLDLKFIKYGDIERFVVTTDANFNLASYVNSTNNKLREFRNDEINTVFLSDKLAEDSRGDFSILTAHNDGKWMRYDLTRSELLYAAVFELPITQNENGVFWYPDLIALSHQFFEEVEKFVA